MRLRRIHGRRTSAFHGLALVHQVRLTYFSRVGDSLSRLSFWMPNICHQAATTGDGAPPRPTDLTIFGPAGRLEFGFAGTERNVLGNRPLAVAQHKEYWFRVQHMRGRRRQT